MRLKIFFSILVWFGFLLFTMEINVTIYCCMLVSYSFWYPAIFQLSGYLRLCIPGNVINYTFKSELTASSPRACHFFYILYFSKINIISYLITKTIGVILTSFSLNLTLTELINWKITFITATYTHCTSSHCHYLSSAIIILYLSQLVSRSIMLTIALHTNYYYNFDKIKKYIYYHFFTWSIFMTSQDFFEMNFNCFA